MKPRNGSKPPLAIISKSAVWRSESVSESSVVVSGTKRVRVAGRRSFGAALSESSVDPALCFRRSCPAPGARILAGADRLGAMGAADRRVALVVQRVVRNAVLADVVPDVLLRPVRDRVQLPEPEAPVPGELRRAGPVLGVLAADPGDPCVDAGERLAHRLDRADAAAGGGSALPQRGA